MELSLYADIPLSESKGSETTMPQKLMMSQYRERSPKDYLKMLPVLNLKPIAVVSRKRKDRAKQQRH